MLNPDIRALSEAGELPRVSDLLIFMGLVTPDRSVRGVLMLLGPETCGHDPSGTASPDCGGGGETAGGFGGQCRHIYGIHGVSGKHVILVTMESWQTNAKRERTHTRAPGRAPSNSKNHGYIWVPLV